MGDAMKEQENQFLSPTLDAGWLADQMVRIIESGLSDHLVTPHFAHMLLPNLRSLPDYFRWFVATVSFIILHLPVFCLSVLTDADRHHLIEQVGKTHETITDAGNAIQAKTYKFVDQLDKAHGLSSS